MSGKKFPTRIHDGKLHAMTHSDPDIEKFRTDAEIRKLEISAGVRKVVYGTLVVGVAAAAFPFMEKFAEVFFSERIEKIQRESNFEILREENRLAEQLAQREHQLKSQFQNSEMESRRITYLESLAGEARSDQLATRIVLAEFFSFLAVDPDERTRWEAFRIYLYDLQDRLNRERESAIAVLNNPKSTSAQIEAAIAQIRQINRQEDPTSNSAGVAPTDQVSFETLGLDPRTVNGQLRAPTPAMLTEMLGRPREVANHTCQPVTEESLASLMTTDNIGPFRVTLLAPAIESLRKVMARVETEAPELIALIGSAGGLCVRYVQGRSDVFSNHSWGTAVDLKVGETLDMPRDGRVTAGLARIAPFFIEEGWFWGAGFTAFEDSMHFEISEQKLQEWTKAGLLSR